MKKFLSCLAGLLLYQAAGAVTPISLPTTNGVSRGVHITTNDANGHFVLESDGDLRLSGSILTTNANFYQAADSFTQGAANFYAFPNNINGSAINLYGVGALGSPILHIQNAAGKAVDHGLWGASFGLPYTGKFGFDMYDALNITTAFGTPMFWTGTGIYPGDSGVVSHPFFEVDPLNLQVKFLKFVGDSRVSIPVNIFDSTFGTFVNLVTTSSNAVTGAGTIAITNNLATGSAGAGWDTNVNEGSIIVPSGGDSYLVQKKISPTKLLVADLTTINTNGTDVAAGAAYTIQHSPFRAAKIGNSAGGFEVTSRGDAFVNSSSGAGFILGNSANSNSWIDSYSPPWRTIRRLNGTGANVVYLSDLAPDNSLQIDSIGNLQLNAAGLKITGGFNSAGASTNGSTLAVAGNLRPNQVGATKLVTTDSSTNLSGVTLDGDVSKFFRADGTFTTVTTNVIPMLNQMITSLQQQVSADAATNAPTLYSPVVISTPGANAAITNLLELLVTNITTGNAAWITTNGNVHLTNAANSGNAQLTNGGFHFSGSGMIDLGLTNLGPTKLSNSVQMVIANIPSGFVTNDANGNLGSSLNGASLTNLTATNISGLTTNGLTVVRTNFISGQLYTNGYGSPIIVQVNASLGGAAVNGNSVMSLEIAGSTTNQVGVSTLVTSLVTTYTNALVGMVPAGSTYVFTNKSSGSGNTAVIVSGQLAYVSQIVNASGLQMYASNVVGSAGGTMNITNLSVTGAGTNWFGSGVVVTNGYIVGDGRGITNLVTSKIVAGSNVTITTNNSGASTETITIAASGGGSTSTKVLTFGATTTQANSTKYYGPLGIQGTTEANVAMYLVSSLTLTNLGCRWSKIGANTNLTATVFTNGVASSITASGIGVSGVPVSASDTTHSVVIPAGCLVSISVLGNNATSESGGINSIFILEGY